MPEFLKHRKIQNAFSRIHVVSSNGEGTSAIDAIVCRYSKPRTLGLSLFGPEVFAAIVEGGTWWGRKYFLFFSFSFFHIGGFFKF